MTRALPALGSLRTLDKPDQTFTCIEIKSYQRKSDGSTVCVPIWRARCKVCGERYEQASHNKLMRTCPAHRDRRFRRPGAIRTAASEQPAPALAERPIEAPALDYRPAGAAYTSDPDASPAFRTRAIGFDERAKPAATPRMFYGR